MKLSRWMNVMNVLRRLWTGFVAAVAGAALALVLLIAGKMTVGLPLDYLQPILMACISVGFLLGVMIGPRKIGGSD